METAGKQANVNVMMANDMMVGPSIETNLSPVLDPQQQPGGNWTQLLMEVDSS